MYFSAFLTLCTQVDGMVGSKAILPVEQFSRVVGHHFEQQEIGPLRRYLIAPTLCWISPSDRFLHLQCGAGAVLALLLMGGVASAPCLAFLWLLYLSLTTIGDIFLGYQWDALLLETGFLAILFAPWNLLPKSPSRESRPSPTVLWLLRWLLFRLMFASGAVKLLSGDETWRNLSALNYHYETQPLPTWIGWFAHQLPAWFQKTSLIGMFGIELVMPFFIFFPRRLRMIACWSFIGLQVVIALTGNYCFFNLLTIVLCVVLMDDTAILKLFPGKWRRHFGNPGGEGSNYFVQEMSTARFAAGIGRRVLVGLIALVILILTGMQMLGTFRVRVEWPQSLVKLFEYVAPFRSVNSYGLFAVMTTSRPEIIIEGSNDGQNWLAYEFKHKPGDLRRRQRFVAPHQPRLDWQMWFEALRAPGRGPPSGWFRNFCRRLLQGSPEVLSLMERNPFPNAPPKYVRAMVYDYHFTNSAEWRATGIWWRRELIGQYGPVFR